MVFLSAFSAPTLAHIPMQGPHALANTVAPILSNTPKNPSLSMVYLTNSDPGVIVNEAFNFSPFSETCFAKLTALLMSS